MTDQPRSQGALVPAVIAGLAGALAMTLVHESARRILVDAPRLDTIGRRALARIERRLDRSPSRFEVLQAEALGADLVCNTGFFAATVAVGSPRSAPVRGGLVGLLAGLATLHLTPRLGLGSDPDDLPVITQAGVLGLYAGAGWLAGQVYRRCRGVGGS